MKKFLVLTIAAIITMGAAAYSDSGGCGGAMKSSTKGASCCSGDMFSKLNLTADQKAKIDVLKQDCQRATSRSEYQQMFGVGLEKILTPEQLAGWQSHCDSAVKSSGCPYSAHEKTNKQS
jgi:Spy/CpxP family protein refolding chaperone